MHKTKTSLLTVLTWLILLILGGVWLTGAQAEPMGAARAPLMEAPVSGSLMFIENVGQFADEARFQMWGGQGSLWLAEDGLWMTVVEPKAPNSRKKGATRLREGASERRVNLKLSFVGANPQPTIEPFERLQSSVNYLRGDEPTKWRTNVPVWGGVRYNNLYPGIDLEITSEAGQVVPRLVSDPDADLHAVRLRVEGAERVEIGPASSLSALSALSAPTLGEAAGGGSAVRLATAIGEVALPLWQAVSRDGAALELPEPEVNGNEIRAPYDLSGSGAKETTEVVTTKETTKETTEVVTTKETTKETMMGSALSYSTFVGAGEADYANALALDDNGNVVVTGFTYSSDFPTSVGAYESAHHGSADLFVSKLSADGASLLYSTFVGGSSSDSAYGLALDGNGNAVVTGETLSANFPTTSGAYDTTHNGSTDIFLFKLAADGTSLLYSTFVGDSGAESGYELLLDDAGNSVLTGYTESANFPTTDGAFGTTHNGRSDLFVLKVASDGSSLLYSTLVGGNNSDVGYGLALSGNDVLVTGETSSDNFPTTSGAYDTTYNQNKDLFVLKLAAEGTSLAYSTFVGGSDLEVGYALAVAQSGHTVVTGYTRSADFPVTADAYDTTHNGFDDLFVLALDASGQTLADSTFIGGSNFEAANALVLDGAGNAWISGWSESSNFPTTSDAYDRTHNSGRDIVLLKLSADRKSLEYSTFVGHSSHERAEGVALSGNQNQNDVVVAGHTSSADFPTTGGAYDTTHNGDWDLFLFKLTTDAQPTPTATPSPTATNTPTPTATPTTSSTPGDGYEANNACPQAGAIPPDGTIQTHTFHEPGDEDWAWFEATAGVEYIVEGRVPPTSAANLTLEAYEDCDSVIEDPTPPPFSPDIRLQFTAPMNGPIYLRLQNQEGSSHGPQVEYDLSVRSLESQLHSALIIVAGKYKENDPLQENIHHVTNNVYKVFRAQGHPQEQIYYLATDQTLDIDGDGTSEVDDLANTKNLEYAITQWAPQFVGTDPDRALTIFMMDHGGEDKLYLDQPRNERVTPDQLDGWLNQLEDQTNAKVNVVIEACHSGSFINEPQSISKLGRVIVTASDSLGLSYASEEGAIFSDAFFSALAQGKTVKAAFDETDWAIQQRPIGQNPWLDSDGDSLPNRPTDDSEAERRGFTISGAFPIDKWAPHIEQAEIRNFNEQQAQIWAQVVDNEKIAQVWAVVYPPSYNPPQSSEEMVPEPPRIALQKGQQVPDVPDGAQYTLDYSQFTETGEYRVVIYAQDDDRLISHPKELTIVAGDPTPQLYLPLLTR